MKRLILLVLLVAVALSVGADVTPAGELWFRTYYIVRHAEKVADGTKDPVLSPAGEARAQALGTMLKDAGIDTFFASQYKRTQLTAQAVADAYHTTKPVVTVDAGDPDELIKQCRTVHGNVLIAGHSNTVPELIHKLTGREFTIADDEYDNLFIVVEAQDGRTELIRLHFGERYVK